MKQNWGDLHHAAHSQTTIGGVLRAMSTEIYPPGDPELIFVDWMITNLSNLKSATAALGVVVEDGPQFAQRLKAAVLPKLLEGQQDGQ